MLYTVRDVFGTRQRTWTLKGAMEWLPYCAPYAEVHDFWGRLIAFRVQSTNIYTV